jgi:hypothetical protein
MTWPDAAAQRASGLFVPKPSLGEGCQRRSALDLGQTVRDCPWASTAVSGDRYSLGYSVAVLIFVGQALADAILRSGAVCWRPVVQSRSATIVTIRSVSLCV